jgi:hypothetical protein
MDPDKRAESVIETGRERGGGIHLDSLAAIIRVNDHGARLVTPVNERSSRH